MKLKTKLIASIMSVCLVCAVFAIGVFALKTANLKIGGDVSFSATGVEAHIKNASLTGAVTEATGLAANDAEGEVINTSMTQTDIDTTFASWQNLKLDFDAEATDIVLKFDIANTSSNVNNYIEIDYDYSFTTQNPNVDVFPGDENAQDVWENNNYILAPKGATPAAGDYETFTLKVRVLNDELNVPENTKLNLTISLKHTTPVGGTLNGTELTTADGIIYTLNSTNKTASLGDNSGVNVDNVVIAPVVTNGTNNYVVTSIGGFFSYNYGPANIETVAIPASVTSIVGMAFFGCSSLTSINIPASVTYIGDTAFDSCGFTSINIPNTVTSIGGGAFSACSSLISVTIPASMTSIGGGAFSACSSLISVTIPASVTSIGGGAFDGCSSLNSIVVESGNTAYDSRNNCNAIIETATNTLLWGCQNTIIPSDVISIEEFAFFDCGGLTSIIIPESVTNIGRGAFSGCSGLTSITIPESVTNIGDNAFPRCSGLTSIVVERGNSVYDSRNNCNAIIETATNTLLWGCQNTIIPSDVTSIGRSAFEGCTGLTLITIPNTVTSIGYSAFEGCTGLTLITIPNSVTSISSRAFYRCTNLASVTFEETSGWLHNSSNGTGGTAIDVTNPETNATNLKSTYYNKYWNRTVA